MPRFILASMKKINLQNQEANEKFSMRNESQSDHKKLACFSVCYVSPVWLLGLNSSLCPHRPLTYYLSPNCSIFTLSTKVSPYSDSCLPQVNDSEGIHGSNELYFRPQFYSGFISTTSILRENNVLKWKHFYRQQCCQNDPCLHRSTKNDLKHCVMH